MLQAVRLCELKRALSRRQLIKIIFGVFLGFRTRTRCAAYQPFFHWKNRGDAHARECAQMRTRELILPHESVHSGGTHYGAAREIPRSKHTSLHRQKNAHTHARSHTHTHTHTHANTHTHSTDTHTHTALTHTTRLSHRPHANLASVLADNGATTNTSAHLTNCTHRNALTYTVLEHLKLQTTVDENENNAL